MESVGGIALDAEKTADAGSSLQALNLLQCFKVTQLILKRHTRESPSSYRKKEYWRYEVNKEKGLTYILYKYLKYSHDIDEEAKNVYKIDAEPPGKCRHGK